MAPFSAEALSSAELVNHGPRNLHSPPFPSPKDCFEGYSMPFGSDGWSVVLMLGTSIIHVPILCPGL